MPIIRDESGDVHVEYSIPNKYKKMMSYDFLVELRKQLFKIHEYYNLFLFSEEGIPMNTSTSGWVAAFYKACDEKSLLELFDYYKGLDWMDSDIFDGIVADMLEKEGLILTDKFSYIYKHLGLNDGYYYCYECNKLFLEKDLDEYIDEDLFDEDDEKPFICKNCSKKGSAKSLEETLIDDFGDPFEFISKALSIEKESLVECPHCKGIYTLDMGTMNKNEFICDFCKDMKRSKDKNTYVSPYYKEVIKELDDYTDKKKNYL